MVDAAGIFREVALFWKGVKAGEQGQSFIGDQGHGMALPFDGPKFHSQAGAQGLLGGDHFGSRQVGALGQLMQLQVHHVWQEKKQAPAAGDQGTIAQMELAHIGNRFRREGRLAGRIRNPDGTLDADIPLAWFR